MKCDTAYIGAIVPLFCVLPHSDTLKYNFVRLCVPVTHPGISFENRREERASKQACCRMLCWYVHIRRLHCLWMFLECVCSRYPSNSTGVLLHTFVSILWGINAWGGGINVPKTIGNKMRWPLWIWILAASSLILCICGCISRWYEELRCKTRWAPKNGCWHFKPSESPQCTVSS